VYTLKVNETHLEIAKEKKMQKVFRDILDNMIDGKIDKIVLKYNGIKQKEYKL
jgi:hypothetical protein